MYLAGLVSAGLVASGFIGVYFSYKDTRALVDELQREKARAAASRIEQFILNVERQLRSVAYMGRAGAVDYDRRHAELAKLLRLAPSVNDAAWLDQEGRERVRVSRMGRDVIGANIDRSSDPGYLAARTGGTWRGGVTFRRQTEPHLAVMVPGITPEDGMVSADINLRFAADVVKDIRVGVLGHAYVVDSQGLLIAHPDTARVLRMLNLGDTPAVRGALAGSADATSKPTLIVKTEDGNRTLTAHAAIATLGWHVVVEQPLAEAFAPISASLARALTLLAVGIVLAIAASLVLARHMTSPVRTLELGAQRIGEGHLHERVEVRTRDELQALAEQFNRMADRVRESQAGLERKILERTRELEDANNAKARFLAAASHDLRQPVHALGLFVAQLQETHDSSTRARLIERVIASTNAVSDLIEALLDISKLDAGAVETRPVDFVLQSLFDRIEHAIAPAAEAKGLRLRIRPTTLCARSDPILLERIILNLCANAVRYTRQGGAIVTARARNARIRIQVWDTGIGIPPHHQPHIFEEFYQADAPLGGESRGLGLGLAIVDRLARLLGCPVTVRSTPGRGSVFAVDVPQAEFPVIADPAIAEQVLGTRFDGMRVMLIDDDSKAREATEGVLTHWGCNVLSACDGKQALGLLHTGVTLPDLIVCDYRLGSEELGTDVVRAIRARTLRDIPAVIVSADAGAAVQEATAGAGLHLMHKPLNAARLRAFLTHVAVGMRLSQRATLPAAPSRHGIESG